MRTLQEYRQRPETKISISLSG